MHYTADMRCGYLQAARRNGRAWLLAAACVMGCGEATHTIGRLRIDAAPSGQAARGSMPGSGTGGAGAGATAAVGTANAGRDAAGSPGGGPAAAPDGTGGQGSTSSMTCPAAAVRKPLDLYFMIDNNVTLPDPRAWTGLVQGVIRYVTDGRAEGTGVGIGFFGLQCSENAYAVPTVSVAPLPKNAGPLTTALSVSLITGILNTSPMLPALGGAVRHASSLANSFGLKAAVVLISDGFDSFPACPSAPTDVVQKATDGFRGSPSIETYVLAADNPLSADPQAAARFMPLDDIARFGGTGAARRVDVVAEAQLIPTIQSALADTLVEIQHEAEPCDYSVTESARLNPGTVPLVLGDGSMSSPALPLVADAASCTGQGYYFALNAAGKPDWAVLCPATCAEIKKQQVGLSWLVPCASM